MATVLENEAAWSTAAATNANVDTGINWVEGQDAASVNNSARGMMAARRKATLDQCGALIATGTTDALIVNTNQVLSPAHLAPGLRLVVQAGAAGSNATTAPTLAADGNTAYPIKRADGTALAAGSIKYGMHLDLVWNAANDWRALNIAPGGASQGSFRAHKAGINQPINVIIPVQVLFGVPSFNNGGFYVSNAWTPPAGMVQVTASVQLLNFDSNGFSATIYKNGGALSQTFMATGTQALVTILDIANGIDVYTVYAQTSTDNSCLIGGNTALTWFQGVTL